MAHLQKYDIYIDIEANRMPNIKNKYFLVIKRVTLKAAPITLINLLTVNKIELNI
jgi:hypothetical protein